jgi:hypothetical protein
LNSHFNDLMLVESDQIESDLMNKRTKDKKDGAIRSYVLSGWQPNVAKEYGNNERKTEEEDKEAIDGQKSSHCVSRSYVANPQLFVCTIQCLC